MFVHGGASCFGSCFSEVHVLDMQARAWARLDVAGPHAPACFSHTMAIAHGMLVLSGGCPWSHAGVRAAFQAVCISIYVRVTRAWQDCFVF